MKSDKLFIRETLAGEINFQENQNLLFYCRNYGFQSNHQLQRALDVGLLKHVSRVTCDFLNFKVIMGLSYVYFSRMAESKNFVCNSGVCAKFFVLQNEVCISSESFSDYLFNCEKIKRTKCFTKISQ